MNINIEKLKNDMSYFSYMNNDFFIDCLRFQLSFNYYGEKIARLFYNYIGNKILANLENQHAKDFKKVIGTIPKIDSSFFNFIKMIIKTKDKNNFYDVINYIETISITRYEVFLDYIEDEKFIKVVNEILEEEKEHGKVFKGSKFIKNFEGFEGLDLYNKYKDLLNLDYNNFKTQMWNTVFLKKLRKIKNEYKH